MAEAKKAAKSSKPKTDSKSKETKEKQLKHGDVVAEAVAPENAPEAVIEVEPVTEPKAKAGKRSAKSVKETEEKQAKQERKAEPENKTTKPAGTDEIFAKLDKEELDFDVLIATPAMMPKLGKYARLLGPRGLMPNPKSGTVSQNPESAVAEAKAGKVEYRVDQSGIVHLSAGKVSFGAEKLTQNAEAILASIRAAKPASLKGIYMQSIYVTTTMGPSIKVEI
jgi:ribosomal protein L1